MAQSALQSACNHCYMHCTTVRRRRIDGSDLKSTAVAETFQSPRTDARRWATFVPCAGSSNTTTDQQRHAGPLSATQCKNSITLSSAVN